MPLPHFLEGTLELLFAELAVRVNAVHSGFLNEEYLDFKPVARSQDVT